MPIPQPPWEPSSHLDGIAQDADWLVWRAKRYRGFMHQVHTLIVHVFIEERKQRLVRHKVKQAFHGKDSDRRRTIDSTPNYGSASNLTFKLNQLYKIQVRIEADEEFGHVGGDSALKLSP